VQTAETKRKLIAYLQARMTTTILRFEIALEDAYASVSQPCTGIEKAWAGALATAVIRFVDADKIKCMGISSCNYCWTPALYEKCFPDFHETIFG